MMPERTDPLSGPTVGNGFAALVATELKESFATLQETGRFPASRHFAMPFTFFINGEILSCADTQQFTDLVTDFSRRFAAMGITSLSRNVDSVQRQGPDRFKAICSFTYKSQGGAEKVLADVVLFGSNPNEDFALDMAHMTLRDAPDALKWSSARERMVGGVQQRPKTSGKLNINEAPLRTGSMYLTPLDEEVRGRSSLRLGDLGGLTQFGANIVILEPGAKSSLRHWHVHEDEFVMILEGQCTLVDDNGRTEMGPGDCAAFPAGVENGHHFINTSDREARFLVIGTRAKTEIVYYSDHDLRVVIEEGKASFTKEHGSDL